MNEKIILSIQNPESILISYVDIQLDDKNVSLEVLSKDSAKISLPYNEDSGEGEIVVRIRYKTLPKSHVNTKGIRKANHAKIKEKEYNNKNNKKSNIIIADSRPMSLEDIKKEIKYKEKKKKLNDIIIVY